MNEMIISDLMEQDGQTIKGMLDQLTQRRVPLADVFIQVNVKQDDYEATCHGRRAALDHLAAQAIDLATDPYALALAEPAPAGTVLVIFSDETGFMGIHLGEIDPLAPPPAKPS